MVGGPGLDIHLASLGAASCPPGDLRHKLKGPFGRPEVGEMEPCVGIHDAHDRHVRKIEPLCDHLGAEQDVDRAGGHALEHAVMRPLGAGGVQIHAGNASLGESQTDEVLQLLRAEAPHPVGRLTAVVADGGDRLFVAAVVAAERRRRLVDRECDRAARAIAYTAAGGTLEVRREATPVQEQDHLLLAPQGAPNGLVEGLAPGHCSSLGHTRRTPEIDHFHGRQRSRSDAVGQVEPSRSSSRC